MRLYLMIIYVRFISKFLIIIFSKLDEYLSLHEGDKSFFSIILHKESLFIANRTDTFLLST